MSNITTVYKFTDSKLQTHDGFQWEPEVWKETSGEGGLCGPGWLHCYSDPLVAVLFDHAGFLLKDGALLWRSEADGQHLSDFGEKEGYTKLRILESIPIPKLSIKILNFVVAHAYRETFSKEEWPEMWKQTDESFEGKRETVDTVHPHLRPLLHLRLHPRLRPRLHPLLHLSLHPRLHRRNTNWKDLIEKSLI